MRRLRVCTTMATEAMVLAGTACWMTHGTFDELEAYDLRDRLLASGRFTAAMVVPV